MMMKRCSRRSDPRRAAALGAACAALALAADPAHAGPKDGVVTAGAAVIGTPKAGLTRIDQQSRSVSIDWSSFDVAAGEHVIFNQPSASSVALNRIFDQNPSSIQGSLTANGRVFLINPNGIIFGASARIDVGSLVASSLDLVGGDFDAGHYAFATAGDGSGSIRNSGRIGTAPGGSVTLLGGAVSNDGLIVADYGTVNLGAGRAATLDFAGDGLVRFRVDEGLLASSADARAAIDNAGEIRADGGQVLLTARAASDVVARAVNNDGVIRAARIENVGGVVRLLGPEGSVVNGGALEATGIGADGTGGRIEVTGRDVRLSAASRIDASGAAGGGRIFVGGGFAGADPSISDAEETRVDAGAILRADALLRGDAGSIAVWSNGSTRFDGDVFARALGPDGDGGYAEISGLERLAIGGHADLGAARGAAGTLLLDPGSITIADGPNAAPGGDHSAVNDGWIVAQLAGSNLVVQTSDSSDGLAEDLLVDSTADVSWAGATSLTLRGGASVTLAAGSRIANTGTGALVLDSPGGAVSIGGTVSLGGDLTVDAGAGITQSAAVDIGGDLSWTAGAGITQSATLDVGGDFAWTAGAGVAQSAALTVGGGLTVDAAGPVGLAALTLGGDLDVTAGGAISQSGALGVAGSASFTTLNDAGAGITLGSANRFGSVSAAVRNAANSADAPASIVVRESDDTLLGDFRAGAGQSVSIESGGGIAALAGSSLVAPAVSLTASGNIGAPAAPLLLALANGRVDAESTGSVYLANTGGAASFVALDRVVAGVGGSIDFSSDGRIEAGDLRAANSISLTSTAGSIVDASADGAGSRLAAGSVTLLAAGSIGEAPGIGAGPLELQTESVSARAQGGAVYLDEASGGLGIRQIVAAGAVGIRVPSGSLFDDPNDAATASIASAAGGIQLAALDSIGDIVDIPTRNAAPIVVDTNGGLLAASVASATGEIALEIAAGSAFTSAPGGISAGGSGRLFIQSPGDLSLIPLTGVLTGFSEAAFSADGTLTAGDNQANLAPGPLATLLLRGGVDIAESDRSFDLSADHLIFDSGGQGGAVTLNIDTNLLDAAVRNGAGLTLTSAGDLVLGSISAGGDVSIAAANILDDGDAGGLTTVAAGGTLTLTASGGIGRADGAGGGRLDTTGATAVSFAADSGDVFIAHQGNLHIDGGETRSGSIDIAAPTGSLTITGNLLSAGSLTLAAGTDAAGGNPGIEGDIALLGTARADGSILLGAHGGGEIQDASDGATHLFARDAHFEAGAVGAAGNALDVGIASLSANVANALRLAAAGDLTLDGVAAGELDVDAAGRLALADVTAGALGVEAAADVAIGRVAADTAAIRASGAIADDGDAATRLSARTATLSGTSIGGAAAGAGVDTAVDTLSAAASAGGVYIDEADDVVLGAVEAGPNADVVVNAGGAIRNDGDASTYITGARVVLGAAALGAAGANGSLDTRTDSLTATASAGGVFVCEADDLVLGAVTAGAGGDVAIDAGGALVDDGDDSTRVAGASVSFSATSIGAAGSPLALAADTLSAAATAGGVYLAERDSITLADVRSSGAGNEIDLATGNDGDIVVVNAATEGGAVNLAAGGTGSLEVTGNIESNGGVVNLSAGDALAVPGISSGAGSVVLHTVNDLNVGTITAGSVSIASDTGDVTLGTVDAGTGTASITASNGAIVDGGATSLTAGEATLAARSIGSADNPLNVAVSGLTAHTTGGGVFVDEADAITVHDVASAGAVHLAAGGALAQAGAISGAGSIALRADDIAMLPTALTTSDGGDIAYVATAGDITLGTLDAGGGRALLIAGNGIYSALAAAGGASNVTAGEIEIRAGGLRTGPGEVGTAAAPLGLSASAATIPSVFVIVPTTGGIQTSTPRINFAGASSSILLKGYTGTSGALFFDESTAFNTDATVVNGESLVPLRNGRIAVNSDSLGAATQALASGVVNRVNIDWAAFDPNVTLFGTLDPPLRLPADQVDELR